MDIPLNAEVICTDGTNGRSVCILINPVQNAVTHVVIETKGLLGVEYMVPVEHISSSTENEIYLDCSRKEMIDLEPFVRARFIGSGDPEYGDYHQTTYQIDGDEDFLWPYASHGEIGMTYNSEQIPHGELGIHRGSHVEATDGRIGKVDEFIINPENNHITHMVLREGHLWGESKDVAIPISDISSIDEDVVHLKLDKKSVKGLPSIPVNRKRKEAN